MPVPQSHTWPILALLLAHAVPAVGEDAGGSFFDDFESLDESRWLISDGWANGKWMDCIWSRRAIGASGGNLRIYTVKSPAQDRDFICGEIQSRPAFGYGTYEIAFRTEGGSGLNAAFFTYSGPSHGTPHHEIDVEVLLRDPGGVSFNSYVDGKPENGQRVELATRADEAVVRYAFTWSEDAIVWYVDGKERHRTAPGSAIPAPPQKLFASFWASDAFPDWMGPLNRNFRRKTMTIDWIAYTEAGANCQFPASILCAER